MTWWFTRDEEHLWGACATREEAIQRGTRDFDGDPFFICQGGHFRNSFEVFDIDWVADRFNDINEDYAGEEDPAECWSQEHWNELERELVATMKAWGERHGYDKAWGIDASPSERIEPASVDTHPEGGDGTAPFMSGAVGEAETPEPQSQDPF